jgi:hypothetical protein
MSTKWAASFQRVLDYVEQAEMSYIHNELHWLMWEYSMSVTANIKFTYRVRFSVLFTYCLKLHCFAMVLIPVY